MNGYLKYGQFPVRWAHPIRYLQDIGKGILIRLPPKIDGIMKSYYRARVRMFGLHFSFFNLPFSIFHAQGAFWRRHSRRRSFPFYLSACSSWILRSRVNYAPLVHLSYPVGRDSKRNSSEKVSPLISKKRVGLEKFISHSSSPRAFHHNKSSSIRGSLANEKLQITGSSYIITQYGRDS